MRLPALLKVLTGIDMAVCALLALPGVSSWFLGVLDSLNAALGLSGGPTAVSPEAFFFVNLAGAMGVAYNLILFSSHVALHHRINNVARLGVTLLLILHIGFNGLPQLYYLFVGTELLGFAVTHHWLNRARRAG